MPATSLYPSTIAFALCFSLSLRRAGDPPCPRHSERPLFVPQRRSACQPLPLIPPTMPDRQHHGKPPRNTPVSLQGKPCGQTRRKTRPYPPTIPTANPRPTHGQPPRPTHGQPTANPRPTPTANPRPTHGQPTANPRPTPTTNPPANPPANPRRPTRFASRLAPTWQGAPLRH